MGSRGVVGSHGWPWVLLLVGVSGWLEFQRCFNRVSRSLEFQRCFNGVSGDGIILGFFFFLWEKLLVWVCALVLCLRLLF